MDDIKKLQKWILYIANEVVKICEKYSIPYSIDGGTLLGAVRHKGFIPWDDDLDIAMLRKDYERFLEVCETELDKDRFFLQTEWNEMDYAFSFSKIQLVGTEIIEDFSKNVNIHHGIFVDIFPYDNLPDNLAVRKRYLRRNHILKNLIWVKCGYGGIEHKGKLSYKIFKVLSMPLSIPKLKSRRYKLITKYNNQRMKEVFNSDYPENFLRKEWFSEMKIYEFEGEKMLGFRDADAFLTTLYGNYMQLPPEEDRITHTAYQINYGKYNSEVRE